MLNFILGPSGSGKSYQMLAELRTRAERGERSILIVPEQFTSSTEGVLYRTLGDSLSAYVESYSFTSLSEALLRRYGGAAVPTLTEAGRALLLRRAADSLLDKVVYYSRQRRSAAFCEKAAQTISELKSAGVTPEMLAEYAKTPGADREKLDELALIYNAYEGLLAQSAMDPGDRQQRAAERLDAEFHFDAVCAVCAPYRTAFALEAAAIGGKKFLWQLDPYASNRDYTAPGGFAREGQLLDALDGTFVTPQALPDYADGAPLAPWREKVHVLGFPTLLPRVIEPVEHDDIQCVFCGSLHPGMREPGFALALFRALHDDAVTLTMAGGGWERFEADADETARALGAKFVRSGLLPPDEAAALENRADVLVSLGNTYDNQMPSKLFGYFATGKPVLHLAVSENDPTLPYLARYPLALVLYRKDGVTPGTVAKLHSWLHNVQGHALPFAQTARLYPEFTPEKVAEEFLKWL